MAQIGLRLVSGVMGGGKSYFLAETIFDALREGAQVHTNLDLNYEEVERRGWTGQVVDLRKLNVKTDMKSVIRAGDENRPNLLVLDEAALFFYVDDQNAQQERADNRDVLLFLTWARRFGLEIYFATQSAKNINVKLRRMSEYTIKCRNVTQVPLFGWLLAGVGGEFRRHIFLSDEDKEVHFTTSRARFRKEIGDFYHTHGFVGQAENQAITLNKVVTRRVPQRLDQRRGKVVFASFVGVGVFCLWLLCHVLYGFMHPKSGEITKSVATSPAKGGQMLPASRVAMFVSRSPRLLVWTDKREAIYSGAVVDGKTVKFLADYGSVVGITYDDKSTENILLKRP